jgi:manganese efflux pump family protein
MPFKPKYSLKLCLGFCFEGERGEMLLFIFNNILLGVGLAMDAFSVSMANGLNEPNMTVKKGAFIAFVFGAFQAIMPMTGWLCVHTIVETFKAFEKFIPWIALILLAYIGGKMIKEGLSKEEELEEEEKKLSHSDLFIQGVATSIDALSVGFTISSYNLAMAIAASLIIAIVTFFICLAGVKIGKTAGTKLSNKAQLLGGTILILIGLEIFISGVFF